MYKTEGSVANPFLPFFLTAFEQQGDDFAEKLFIAELLLNPVSIREVSR